MTGLEGKPRGPLAKVRNKCRARAEALRWSGGASDVEKNTESNTKHSTEKWTRIGSRLRAELGEDVYTSWFGRVELEDFNSGVLKLSVPTRFLSKWIKNHYYDKLLDCSHNEFDGLEEISFRVRTPHDKVDLAARNAPAKPTMASNAFGETDVVPFRHTAPLGETATGYDGIQGSPLDQRCTFDSFQTGTSNQLAHAAALEVADGATGPILRYNPLYIHGNVGLGKTHLLHAVSWAVREKNPDARVLYLTAELFMSGFVKALRARDAVAFKEKLRQIDILLIDDLEFLQGPTIQQEFCHMLNAHIDGNKQVVVAADRAPLQLDKLDARMRSRLAGGLIVEVGALDYDLRLKILRRRAEAARRQDPGFVVPEAVLGFLATRVTDSGRELDGCINSLRAASALTKQPVTMESAEKIVRDLTRGAEPRRVKIDEIQKIVSKHFGVSRSDILSSRRTRSIVRPRQIAMYLSKHLTSRSLPEIGRRFGDRDHTTVLHAIRKIGELMQDDTTLKDDVELLKRLLIS